MMTCSQTKCEGGERCGQCKFKDSERKENLQIYKAPELAWDLDVRTIAVKSKHNGWLLEVFHGKHGQGYERQGWQTQRDLEKKDLNTKNQL
jgi:hypothetical protein